jgi:hypothetical protein
VTNESSFDFPLPPGQNGDDPPRTPRSGSGNGPTKPGNFVKGDPRINRTGGRRSKKCEIMPYIERLMEKRELAGKPMPRGLTVRQRMAEVILEAFIFDRDRTAWKLLMERTDSVMKAMTAMIDQSRNQLALTIIELPVKEFHANDHQAEPGAADAGVRQLG